MGGVEGMMGRSGSTREECEAEHGTGRRVGGLGGRSVLLVVLTGLVPGLLLTGLLPRHEFDGSCRALGEKNSLTCSGRLLTTSTQVLGFTFSVFEFPFEADYPHSCPLLD